MAVWRWLRRPDGFKAGVVTITLLLALYFSKSPEFHRGLRNLDARLVDWMFQWRLKWRGPTPTANRCVIVDVDDKSLAQLGQWPWPRTKMAEILRKVSEGKPARIGIDMVFAEPDRLSPRRYVAELARQTGTKIEVPEDALDNDVAFGDALAEDLPVVMGYVFVLERDGTSPPDKSPFPDCNISWVPPPPDDFVPPLVPAYRPLLNVPEIGDCATTEGFFNAWNGVDAVVREVPLFIAYDGRPFPSLVMEMYRASLDEQNYELDWGPNGMLGIRIRDKYLPTTPRGNAMLNWRGPRGTFPYISASDVLSGKISPKVFRDKFVFVGTSAEGLHDLRSSPLDSVIPGVEFHATLMDNILQGDLFRRDEVKEQGIFVFGLVVGGLIFCAVLTYCPPVFGVLFGIAVVLSSVSVNYYVFFLRNTQIGLAFPLLCMVPLLVIVTSVNYLMEDRKKAYIRHAFSHYVSERVVDRLMRDPRSLTLSGEEREMSIMFSDIRGFTGLSEQFDAAGLAAFLNEYLTEMTDILLAEDGTLDKFIGDAVMAFWNAPSDQDDHAARAIGCALRMQAQLAELRVGWEERGLPPVYIGVGIATGPASVGNMGSRDRFNYTVMGDTVNLASRLEGLTKNYHVGILVSEQALNAASWQEHARYVDQVRVKGRSEPVRIFEPLTRPQPEKEAELWHHVIGAYLAGEFAAAKEALDELEETFPDPLYSVYRERLVEFETHPPEDWDGVYTHTTK
jgi:adenylate cyclase